MISHYDHDYCLTCSMAFPLPCFVCADCLCLVTDFLVQAGVCGVFGAEPRPSPGNKAAQQMPTGCRSSTGQGKLGKNKTLIAVAACSKGESVPCVLGVPRARIDLRSARCTGFPLAALFTQVRSLSSLIPGVLQSEVLRLVPPLEGSPVHVCSL